MKYLHCIKGVKRLNLIECLTLWCPPVFELWYITLQPKVKLLCLREKLPEQQHIGVSRVDELHLHLTPHHCLQPIQHFPHFVHCEGFVHQPWQTYIKRKQVINWYTRVPKNDKSSVHVWFSCRKNDWFWHWPGGVNGHLLSLSSSKHESIVFSLRTLFERANRM